MSGETGIDQPDDEQARLDRLFLREAFEAWMRKADKIAY